MRIVLTSNFSPWSEYSGGGQRSTHQLASALVEEGHDVHVVYTAAPGKKPKPDVPTNYTLHWALFFGRKALRSAPMRPLNALSVRHVVSQIHQKSSVDVIHSQGEEGMLVGKWANEQGVGFVVTPRYPSYPDTLGPDMSLGERAWMWLRHGKYMTLEQTLKSARCICPTSDAAMDSVRRAYGLEGQAFEVIPNGIQPTFFEGKWSGESSEEILFFGRLAHDKGVDLLLDAAQEFSFRIHVVGRGDSEERLKRKAVELGMGERLRWTSWLGPTDLKSAIEKSLLVVLPSRHESFGNAMAETLAVGAPLVTTQAGSIPGVVGECAFMAKADCVDSLREEIRNAVEAPEVIRARARQGQTHMAERFQWSAVANAFVDVYSRILNEPEGRNS